MAVKFPIFLDAQSTTPVDPRVVEAMLPWLGDEERAGAIRILAELRRAP